MLSSASSVVQDLLCSTDPSIRYLTRTGLLGEDPSSPELAALREEVRTSARVEALLAASSPDGRLPYPANAPWAGAHWVLGCLAEIGYPPGDPRLIPLREQVYEWLFSKEHERSIHKNWRTLAHDGRIRACAAYEGHALYALNALGLADGRAELIVTRLLAWQWPEGAWNCVDNPNSLHWTFSESLAALRGLIHYAKASGNAMAARAAQQAGEVFLEHNLFEVLPLPGAQADALLLHYPVYGRFDVLAALEVMREGGWLNDPRCQSALYWLEGKRLEDGGFPLEKKNWQTGSPKLRGYSPVDWGPAGRGQSNPFVTLHALTILEAAEQPMNRA